MCFSNAPKDHSADDARAEEEARQSKIRTGMGSINTTFAPFNDAYYAGRSKDYVDWAEPQVDNQYADAKKQLIFALSRTGNLGSSAAADRQSKLTKDYGDKKIAVQSEASRVANEARANTENSRSNLVTQLNASADPDAAASGALAQAQIASAMPSYSPIGQLFQAVTDGIAPALAGPATGYQGLAGLFKRPKSAATVVA